MIPSSVLMEDSSANTSSVSVSVAMVSVSDRVESRNMSFERGILEQAIRPAQAKENAT
jgi:hypothetical protein